MREASSSICSHRRGAVSVLVTCAPMIPIFRPGQTCAKLFSGQLFALTKDLTAKDTDDLLHIYEVKERLVVCKSVIAHLKARKETRWRGFGQNMDYPGTKDDWDKKAVNSVYENGKIKILFRDLTQTPDF